MITPKWKKDNAFSEFTIENIGLMRQAFSMGTSYLDYRSQYGERLIELARQKLNYSDSTYSGDIYVSLFNHYKKL